jgi:hypothetical protein
MQLYGDEMDKNLENREGKKCQAGHVQATHQVAVSCISSPHCQDKSLQTFW